MNAPAPAPRPLKVFQINMHLQWGGQPNRVLTESIGLRELGHMVTVAGPRGCMLCARAREAGLATFEELELRRGFRTLSFWKDYRALRELFRRERFDVIHMHGSQDTWLATLAAAGVERIWKSSTSTSTSTIVQGGGRPALIRSRHNTFPVAGHAFNRWLYGKMDWVVTIAPQVDELITLPTGFPAERITPIYSAPDPTKFYPREGDAKLRAELGIPEGAPVIGKVGRLAPEKGHHLFLRAAALVLREFPEARFVCVGRGRSRPVIEALIGELGIGANVVLTGFRTDVPDVVALFDVFCLTPTAGESLGTSILEGFCMEKPAIATQVGGTGESVRTGETGFLIAPGDEAQQIEQIAEAMLTLLRDPELRRRMGRAGRAMVEREFSRENLARQTEAAYRRAVAHRTALIA
jgi:glycosyltransferase involved in cell wall biosynthesis